MGDNMSSGSCSMRDGRKAWRAVNFHGGARGACIDEELMTQQVGLRERNPERSLALRTR